VAVTFLVVPQWQGSGSSRAMRLVEGAQAISSDLPSSSTVILDVALEAGESQGSGVARLTSLQAIRDTQRQALAGILAAVDGWALTIGGDCGVELASVDAAFARPDVALLWIDAHSDLHTPESSPSGAFHGMVLRTLLGDGTPGLLPTNVVPTERLVLVGTRAFDDAEAEWADAAGVTTLRSDELTAESLVAAVEATGASSVYIHIDLDVLDPSEFAGLGYPEPFGLTAATLVGLLRGVRARFSIVGAGITEFAPASAEQAEDDLPTILRILGALTSPQ